MTPTFNDFDERMMRRAIELALLGRYTNHPNPRVGCVLVQGDRIVGEGWHRKWGEAHAEVRAIEAAGIAARGATAYVTLEPHSYHGRTPPCTEALVRAGVRRVVCGTLDPNPKVQGEGVRQLRAAGIRVETGLLEHDVRELNLGFEKRMLTQRPRVVVKVGASLDGRIALANGASRWITSEASRADVQKLRAAASAVVTGVDTVIADDPRLNVRDEDIETLGRQPLRVVLDSRLRMPSGARMLKLPGTTLVFTGAARSSAAEALHDAGAEIVPATLDGTGRIEIDSVLQELARRQCNDVLIEAGPTLVGRFVELDLVDELIVYIAPVLLGGQARPLAILPALERLEQASRYELKSLQRIGPDVRLILRRPSAR
jgi:diaminohydroxyphosphoribosylaminopyrimidine deaminase/5-amino-6-(5-phosphoribosylamino)uracil reductase